MRQHPHLASASFIALCLLLLSATAARAATYTVTNTQDSGAGSLRDALMQANSTAEPDTIEFQIATNDTGCAGDACTITLTSGQLSIESDLTINGPGANRLTVSGNDASRVLSISSGTVNISGLTISHGKLGSVGDILTLLGGGIYNFNGNVTLSNSTVADNFSVNNGGGIYNRLGTFNIAHCIISGNSTREDSGGGLRNFKGTMNITDSTISGNYAKNNGSGLYNSSSMTITNSTISDNRPTAVINGGGINNDGKITITGSTVSGNRAGFGGGIYSYRGELTIIRSIISGNNATFDGGGIENNAGTMTIDSSTISNNSTDEQYVSFGSGIATTNGTTIINSTISGNKGAVNGGGIYADAYLVIVNSTVTNNSAKWGGGLLGSFLKILNCIVAGNVANYPDVYVWSATSLGHNLIGDESGSAGWISSDRLNVNPLLGPLKDNGGATQTHALLPGSPAINAGDNCVTEATHCNIEEIAQLKTDQRGLPRQSDNVVDIGAYEVQPLNPLDDINYFVRQQYLDFLGRESDEEGLAYWTKQITQCGADKACINGKRVEVSAAFFMEPEFQQTGSFVYRLYEASYGARPTYAQFTSDRAKVVGGQNLEAKKAALSDEFVKRAEFQAAYPDSMSNADFVKKLFDTAQLKPYVAERQARIVELNLRTLTRSQALRDVAEFAEFKQREYNASFVLMQYFGYLRRDPEEEGYQFWLNVLNNRDPNNYKGMVCSFITSAEYQKRFGPFVTHSNSECEP